jgi:hypothetical protein
MQSRQLFKWGGYLDTSNGNMFANGKPGGLKHK